VIVFKLICKDCEISFNSWFSSSIEYEKLKKQKFISCHSCNSLNIEKTLMSPSVFRSKNTPKIDHLDLKYKEIKKIILDNQNYVKKNLNYVGENFAYEARSIHYKNKKVSKGIYGTATKEDLKDLKEEGISTEQIPWVKNTTN
jgi:hypothetical protein|tara:strand:- start:322 stop:750 length:429 start_codon:yes stop_codon:yes gene_type:complete